MKEMFLLGAGASIEAGVPGAFKMTSSLLEAFETGSYFARHNRILRFVVGGLLFQRGVIGENPFEGINVEELFNAVQLLAERGTSEIGPFVGSWHPLLNELETGAVSTNRLGEFLEEIYKPLIDAFPSRHGPSHDSDHDKVDSAIEKFIREGRRFGKSPGQAIAEMLGSSLEKLASRFRYRASSRLGERFSDLVRESLGSQSGSLFRQTADLMLQHLTEIVWIEDASRVSYLVPLLNYSFQNNAAIATLNYDNVVELSGESAGIAVETGIETWSRIGEFRREADKVWLLKLHGSIDWALSDGPRTAERPMPYQVISKVTVEKANRQNYRPAVIFGGRNKLTAKGPFLDLLRAFEGELVNCDRLTAIGYSFRDEHINEYISEWLNSRPSRTLRVINPSFSKLEHSYGRILQQQAQSGRVQVIEKNSSEGIAAITNNPSAMPQSVSDES